MAKTAAFIGSAGPFGYDYRHPAPRVNDQDGSSPNPILENVLGLLLCYDELIFLAPQFCPADMRELPYVRFLTDDPPLLAGASRAIDEFEQAERVPWDRYPSFDRFAQISAEMSGPAAEEFAIDNHTHTLHIGGSMLVGNGMALDFAVRDLWIAAELGLDRADVIFSSPAQEALNGQLEMEVSHGHYFGPVKRSAATTLVALQVPNFLGSGGSYHEALEGLRERRDTHEFRAFLSELDAPTADGVRLADDISRAAFATMDDLSRRYLKDKHWFRSWGVPAVRGALNFVYPALGTAVAVGVEAPFEMADRRFKKASRWAPFVVALHRPPD